jgi:hypothetical protein
MAVYLGETIDVLAEEGTTCLTTYVGCAPPRDGAVPHRIFHGDIPDTGPLVGRDEVLTQLFVGPADGVRKTLVTAMAGVGKSALAAAYALSRGGEYSGGVFWLSAGSHKALTAGVRDALVAVGQTPPDGADMDALYRAFRGWLSQQPGWLVVFDNADEPDVLARARIPPNAGRGDVLITSRAGAQEMQRMGISVNGITLKVLPPDDAVVLLAQWARRPLAAETDAEASAARRIAGKECLDGLPLALTQAGAIIRSGFSYGVFEREWRSRLTRVREDDAPKWPLSLRAFLESHGAARRLWTMVGGGITLDDLLGGRTTRSGLEKLGIPEFTARNLIELAARQAHEQALEQAYAPARARRAVGTVWRASLARLSAPARHRLRVVAFLAPDFVPRTAAPDAAWDELERFALVTRVKRSPLPGVANAELQYSMHRVLRAVVQVSVSTDARPAVAEAARDLVAGGLPTLGTWNGEDPEVPRITYARWAAHARALADGELAPPVVNEKGGLEDVYAKLLLSMDRESEHSQMLEFVHGLLVRTGVSVSADHAVLLELRQWKTMALEAMARDEYSGTSNV